MLIVDITQTTYAIAPVVLAAIIAGAATIFNSVNQGRVAKKSREYQEQAAEKEYERNKEMWEMQNAYNSPKQMAQRNIEAGLNPNLTYGSVSNQRAGEITPVKQPTEFGQPVQFDIDPVLNTLNTYADFQQKKATTDNVKANTELAGLKANEISATTARILQQTARDKFDYALAQDLRDQTVMNAVWQNKLNASNYYLNIGRNEREAMSNAMSLTKGFAEVISIQRDIALKDMTLANNPTQMAYLKAKIKNLNQATTNLGNQNLMDKLEYNLKSKGLTWSDPYAIRLGLNLLGDVNGDSLNWLKTEDGKWLPGNAGKGVPYTPGNSSSIPGNTNWDLGSYFTEKWKSLPNWNPYILGED